MGKRFEDLDRFLPPPPASEPRSTGEAGEPTRSPARRSRVTATARLRRAARAGVASLAVAVALISVALAVASLPAATVAGPDGPPPATGADVSLGAAASRGAETDGRRRDETRERNGSTRRGPRRVRHRLQLAPRSPRRKVTTALPPVAAAQPDKPEPKAAARSRPQREEPSPPPPAPPQTPLFHCISGPGNEHYVTIDRARAGQLSSPNSGWRCSVAGQVYQEPGPGRAAIELDDGTAYVLERREETEPSAELFPLYRHWVSYDWYYSERPADGGLVGYVAA